MASEPLVSVIIPCYNHASYLNQAIQSVIGQSYSHLEIIVVDDGSTEDIKLITDQYSQVIYIRQNNQGLCSARNTGIHKSSGEYLVFLDADDWLCPEAIEINLNYLKNKPNLAFVSGSLDYYDEKTNQFFSVIKEITTNHYQRLLFNNYIDVPASVLYQRWIFNELLFDKNNNEAGDYDLYLKITRKHEVVHHQNKIAVYRQHASNMSGNYLKMLRKCLEALKGQKFNLKTADEINSFKRGYSNWKIHYGKIMVKYSVKNLSWNSWFQLVLFTSRYPIISCYHLRNEWKRLILYNLYIKWK